MLNYNWKFKRVINESAVEKLSKSLKLPKSLANVLVSRGFETEKSKLSSYGKLKNHIPALHSLWDVCIWDCV